MQHLATSSHSTHLHIFPFLPFLSLPLLSFSSPRQGSINAAAVLYTNSLCSPPVQKEKNIIEATRHATFLLAEYGRERQEEEGDVYVCVGVEEEELC